MEQADTGSGEDGFREVESMLSAEVKGRRKAVSDRNT